MSVPNREQGGEYQISPWITRLFQYQGIDLSENRRKWLAISIDRFLRWCRQRGQAVSLDTAIEVYLKEVTTTEPRPPEWKLSQIRQALSLLANGLVDWRWETSEDGALRPRFRLYHPDDPQPDLPAGPPPPGKPEESCDPLDPEPPLSPEPPRRDPPPQPRRPAPTDPRPTPNPTARAPQPPRRDRA